MESLAFPEVGVAVGVALSVWHSTHSAPNPSDIPFKRIAFRAAPGLLLFYTLGFFASLLVFRVALQLISAVSLTFEEPTLHWLLGLVVGVAIPRLAALKDKSLTLKAIQAAPFVAGVAQTLDEVSRLYVPRLYSREERKLSFEWYGTGNGEAKDRAVDRVFEYYWVEMARRLRMRLPDSRKENAVRLCRCGDRQVKLKFLMRHLGWKAAGTSLTEVESAPSFLYPSWPPTQACRRAGVDPPSNSPKRRKGDHEDTRAYIMGELDELHDALRRGTAAPPPAPIN